MAAATFFGLVLVGTMIAPASASTDWTSQTTGVSTTLFDVTFGTPTAGIAVGAGGKILSTSDGGSNWTARTSGTDKDLRSATAFGSGCGPADDQPCYWAGGAGGTMLWSDNAGVTWCPQTITGGSTEQINDLMTIGPNDVMAVGNKGTILRSGSGGTNAQNCGAAGAYDTVPSGTTSNLYGLNLDPGGNYLAVGAGGTILQKTGAAFAPITSPTTTDLFAIDSRCADPCATFAHYIVGAGGMILKNIDSGAYTKQTSGTTQDLHDVFFQDDEFAGMAVGNRGTAIKTTNGGAAWTPEATGTCSDLFGIGLPAVKAVAAGSNGTIVAHLGSSSAIQPDCSKGFWMLGSDGGVFSFGDAAFQGSTGAIKLDKPVVGMASTPTGKGYWFVATDGGVFNFGDAKFFGSMGGKPLDKPVVGMATTPTGLGYWLVASDGGMFAFGDAKFFGSMGAIPLNKPVVSMAAVSGGQGYWLVAADGGIFSFGPAAKFFGSTGAITLDKPIVGMATAPSGSGYWFVAADGGIFSFGSGAPFLGVKLGGSPVAGMAPAADGQGYWVAHADGIVDHFGTAVDLGGLTTAPKNLVVGMASIRLG